MMTRHQMIFTTQNVVKQTYTPIVTPASRNITRGINSRGINTNPNSFFRGLVFPSKAGCSSCGR